MRLPFILWKVDTKKENVILDPYNLRVKPCLLSYSKSSLSLQIDSCNFSVVSFPVKTSIHRYYNRPKEEPPGDPKVVKADPRTERNIPLLLKLILHILQLLLFNFIIFWMIPYHSNYKLNDTRECTKYDMLNNSCNEPYCNNYIIIFYVLYCAYFWLSAIQIRDGWPISDETAIHKKAGAVNQITTQAFFGIPFAWEIKEFSTWLWTKTSFDLFIWLKFEEIVMNLYIMKCKSKATKTAGPGSTIAKPTKVFMGGFGLCILILLIIAPVVIFSSLNPMVDFNNPLKASLTLTININAKAEIKNMSLLEAGESNMQFTLFQADAVRLYEIEASEMEKQNLNEYDEVRDAERRQIQAIVFPTFLSQYMFPSEALRNDFQKFFSNPKRSDYGKLIMSVAYERKNVPQTITYIGEKKITRQDAALFSDAFNFQLASFNFSWVYCGIQYLPAEGVAGDVYNCSKWPAKWPGQLKSLVFTTNMRALILNDDETMPILSTNIEEIKIYTVSAKAKTSLLMGYSIVTLYVSVVLVIGRLIRGFIFGIIWFWCLPKKNI